MRRWSPYIAGLLLGTPFLVYAATAGPSSPSDTASSNLVGTISWENTANATADDGSLTEAILRSSQSCASPAISEYLVVRDFGFSIPDGATINGITVEVERWSSDSNSVKDSGVYALKGNNVDGENKADTDTFWTSTFNPGYVSYGGSADLWGRTWTPADINAANFGMVLSASICGSDPFHYAKVDHVRITVTYTADTTAPSVNSLTPADGASQVATSSNLVVEFDEAIGKSGTGTVTIKKSSDDSTVETIAVTGALVTGSGTSTITINPASDLDDSTAYYVQISNNAFPDASGNFYAGISDETTWNFTTADETAPTVSSLSPADGATNVSITANLVIEFSETIASTGTGTVTIKKSSDNSTVETIAVTGSLVTGSGTSTITINPSTTLANSTSYYVQISGNAFPDSSSNFYAGISDSITWNFTTVATASPSSSDSSSDEQSSGGGGGGSRGKLGNKRIIEALQQRYENRNATAADSPVGGPDTSNPAVQLLLHSRERLVARVERRIEQNPTVEWLLRAMLERLEKRILDRVEQLSTS